MPDLRIRPIDTADFDRWLPLWEGYNAFYGRSGPTALPVVITQVTWQRFFDDGEPVHALVAELGDDLIGLVHFLYHRSTTSIARICYLQDLFTTELARGRGVGRALITAVDEQARLAGSGRVYWHTHETNATARRLYDKVADRPGFIMYSQTLG